MFFLHLFAGKLVGRNPMAPSLHLWFWSLQCPAQSTLGVSNPTGIPGVVIQTGVRTAGMVTFSNLLSYCMVVDLDGLDTKSVTPSLGPVSHRLIWKPRRNKDNIEFYTFNPWTLDTTFGWKRMEMSRKWPFLHNSRPPEQLRNNAGNQNVNKLSHQQRAASESCSRSDHKLISHGFIFSLTLFGILGTVAHCTRR